MDGIGSGSCEMEGFIRFCSHSVSLMMMIIRIIIIIITNSRERKS
jgi:hypothetical protein